MAPVIWDSVNFDFFIFLQYLKINKSVYFLTVGFLGGLTPRAREILEKYSSYAKTNPDKKLLPVISNQNLNKYLKEIAELCGITKRVSMHLARHTFATTVTLERGIDIMTVSKMLGHKNLRTTQIYSKVTELKIADDMKKLK